MHHARATGTGQVVDAAIVDGTAHLTALLHGMLSAGGCSPRCRAATRATRRPR
ncbi:hypothetical protein [Streptomyces sp. AD55]|uniref:hypothetical protein n=1 Tax=Streptomyces sp. AD55 TaxID=3242895 RepID=UPI0035270248